MRPAPKERKPELQVPLTGQLAGKKENTEQYNLQRKRNPSKLSRHVGSLLRKLFQNPLLLHVLLKTAIPTHSLPPNP